ncbi:MAG: SDR family oxidoreductase [Alcanivoracaceae bacterium]|nr:SDR family oxidoreductase [Alcanivoracaceae bacterium]
MSNTRHTALITGASAGIGAAFAHHLAKEGYDLLLVARRVERLQALQEELENAHGIDCQVFGADLTDPAAPKAIMDFATREKIHIDVLINNAGLSGNYTFAEADWQELGGEIQLMITAVTELCHLVAPGMKARGWGRIINLSSIAAFAPPAASLLYTAIKSYVLNLSQSLDMELKPHGVHVTALCPGFTRSEFHDVMGTKDEAYSLPDILWQDADAVVAEGWRAVEKGKSVCVPGNVNKLVASSIRPLPMKLRYFMGDKFNPFKH